MLIRTTWLAFGFLLAAAGAARAFDDVPAPALLLRARDARAIWHDFPGFTCDVQVYDGGKTQRGRLSVSADGSVELSGLNLDKDSRVEATLQSLVMHRLSESGFSEEVSYADEQRDHPLGLLIRLDYDSRMASAYRVKGDVIREVNRKLGDGRFTISVLEVNRNAKGKYLPGVYSVNFWNGDGTLKSSTTVRETWQRVGGYDLPRTHLAISAGADRHDDVRIDFTNHRLAKEAVGP